MRHWKNLRIAAVLMVALSGRASADETPLPNMPEAFSSFGAAVADGYVYVYGGHVGKTHTYSTEAVTGKFRRLSIANPKSGWEELPAGPAIQGLALVAHRGQIYRIGGMQPQNKPGEKGDNRSLDSVARFDPKTMKWTELPALPAGRSSHDAAVVGDLLVVVGGWNMGGGRSGNYHETALVMDLSKDSLTWTSMPQPFKRRALNVASLDGKVFVVGGMTWENEIEKTVDALDPKTGKWTSVPSLPGVIMNGFTPAACVQGGKLYASPADGKVYRLSDAGDSWSEVAVLADKRLVHRIVPWGEDKLLAIGGASKGGNLSKIEAIEPACCDPKTKTSSAKPGEQAFCPIMVTVPIDEESRDVEFNGVTIKVCCATCVKKFRAEPEAYLNVQLVPQLKDMKLPERKIGQVFCPVYGDRVVSSKDPSTEYNGTTIYFFNESAKARFLADPARYASAVVAPKLQTRQ